MDDKERDTKQEPKTIDDGQLTDEDLSYESGGVAPTSIDGGVDHTTTSMLDTNLL